MLNFLVCLSCSISFFRISLAIITYEASRRDLELMFLKEFEDKFTNIVRVFDKKIIDACQKNDELALESHLDKVQKLLRICEDEKEKTILYETSSEESQITIPINDVKLIDELGVSIIKDIFIHCENFYETVDADHQIIGKLLFTHSLPVCHDVILFLENIHSKYRLSFTQEILISVSPLQRDENHPVDHWIMYVPGKNGYYFLQYKVNLEHKQDEGARIVGFAESNSGILFQVMEIENDWKDYWLWIFQKEIIDLDVEPFKNQNNGNLMMLFHEVKDKLEGVTPSIEYLEKKYGIDEEKEIKAIVPYVSTEENETKSIVPYPCSEENEIKAIVPYPSSNTMTRSLALSRSRSRDLADSINSSSQSQSRGSFESQEKITENPTIPRQKRFRVLKKIARKRCILNEKKENVEAQNVSNSRLKRSFNRLMRRQKVFREPQSTPRLQPQEARWDGDEHLSPTDRSTNKVYPKDDIKPQDDSITCTSSEDEGKMIMNTTRKRKEGSNEESREQATLHQDPSPFPTNVLSSKVYPEDQFNPQEDFIDSYGRKEIITNTTAGGEGSASPITVARKSVLNEEKKMVIEPGESHFGFRNKLKLLSGIRKSNSASQSIEQAGMDGESCEQARSHQNTILPTKGIRNNICPEGQFKPRKYSIDTYGEEEKITNNTKAGEEGSLSLITMPRKRVSNEEKNNMEPKGSHFGSLKLFGGRHKVNRASQMKEQAGLDGELSKQARFDNKSIDCSRLDEN